jgi:hypothetical protein
MPEPAVVVRGPLKYVVETSSPQVEAGKRFSVSVRITNPYDVPVVVKDVATKLPAKFVTPSTEPKKTFLQAGSEILREIAVAKSLKPLLIASGASDGEIVRATAPAGIAGDAQRVELQPGNSTVRIFTIKTVNAVFFAPSLYNLNIEVEYVMDEKLNHDTVAYQMNVRAPLTAIITGSVVGSVIGYLVKASLDVNVLPGLFATAGSAATRIRFGFGLVTAVLVAGVVVVAFARKKDAQPILAIEDFWGGLFVGFLSAYGGEALLKQIAGTGA